MRYFIGLNICKIMVVDLLSTTWFTFIILPFADSLCNTDIYHYIIHYDATQNYYYYFKI